MTSVSLVFLVVCIFGAFAYGSATLMALRQMAPVWSPRTDRDESCPSLDRVSLTMFVVCALWFTLSAVAEFRALAGTSTESDWVDLAVFALAFLFPPLIMHVVHRETGAGRLREGPGPWKWPVWLMYAVSPMVGVFLLGGALDYWVRPQPFGRVIGIAFAVLFTITSVYSAVISTRRRAGAATIGQRRLGHAMLSLFFLLVVASFLVAVLHDRSLLVAIFSRISRSAPILFLAVAMYFENRFEFYDLVFKRGITLVATIAAFGLVFLLAQPVLDGLPGGAVRPWLAAIVLLPATMTLPWLSRTLSAGLDRLWFGRTFAAVDAVKHLLGAMQPANDERTLTQAAERRLADIFNAPVAVRVDDQPAAHGRSVEVEAATPSGGRVRFEVMPAPAARRLLSEDMAMLRSLASVFGFMLETIRLQHKRQEQEQVAQHLRLQTSRSELKALRAQINPHFLFNALNAIASLIHTNPGRADAAVEQLAEVFRYTLRRSDTEWAPLDQELAFARAYLDVECARFGPRLIFSIESDHLSPSPLVPSMLLQTLIENAVKHGVSHTRGPGRIDVVVRTADGDLVVEVRDNGPGPEAARTSPREGEGFGLRSVRERLAGHFGDRAHLSLVRDEGAGLTIARITMPAGRAVA